MLGGVRPLAPLLLAAAGAAAVVALIEGAGGDFSGWPQWRRIAHALSAAGTGRSRPCCGP